MKHHVQSIAALAVVLGWSAAAQATFIIDQPTTNNFLGANATGQSFTPNVGIAPVPSGSSGTIDLTAFEVTVHDGTGNNLSATTYLQIYEGAVTPGDVSNLVGWSTNTHDTTNVVADQVLSWTFSGLTLDYETLYSAILSGDDDTYVIVGMKMKNENTGPYAGGTALAVTATPHVSDLRFKATFDNFSVPEPSSFCLTTVAVLGLLRWRRGRRG